MTQTHLPSDPFAAHDVVLARAQEAMERRQQERRKPLPEHAQVEVCFFRSKESSSIQAEVLDVSSSGMQIAAFANHQIQSGDRCTITMAALSEPFDRHETLRWATVRWVSQHPFIQVFGVQFD